MSIPLSDDGSKGVLTVASNFFEFVPVEQVAAHPDDPGAWICLTAGQVETGAEYYILVTTADGLYRYDINDIVRVEDEGEGDDAVLDLDVTTNRVDAMNVYGLAREVAVIYDRPLRPLELSFTEAGPEAAESLSVEIDAPELCPRFAVRVLDVRLGPEDAGGYVVAVDLLFGGASVTQATDDAV